IGFQLSLCVYGLAVYLETPRNARKGRVWCIVLSFAILATSAAGGITNRWQLINEHTAFGETAGMWSVKWAAESLLPGVLTILGDGVLLFRCYMIWSDKRWVALFPTFIYLAAIVAGLIVFARVLEHGTFEARTVNLSYLLGALSVALPVLFNVTTTVLIVWRIVKWRHKLSWALSGRHVAKYSGAAMILIEAALPLSLSGIAYASILFAAYGGRFFRVISVMKSMSVMAPLSATFESLYLIFVVLSPQLVIFRVTTGRSFS
ncbi:hypothetical protein FA15DRAFT_561913, partial [Coprinopsis marcescibilis]